MLQALAIVGGIVVGWWLLRFLLAVVIVTRRNRQISRFETERFMERGCRANTPDENRRDMIDIWTRYHGVPQSEAERRYDELERDRQSARGRGPNASDDRASREALIRGAATSPLRQGSPPVRLNEFARDTLLQLYGPEWLQENEELLRAMLSLVGDFQALDDDDAGLREFMADDARECCLLNIFNCMRVAGAFTQPTIPKQTADVGDFMLAFSNGDLMSVGDPKSTMFTLGLAVRFASQATRAA